MVVTLIVEGMTVEELFQLKIQANTFIKDV